VQFPTFFGLRYGVIRPSLTWSLAFVNVEFGLRYSGEKAKIGCPFSSIILRSFFNRCSTMVQYGIKIRVRTS